MFLHSVLIVICLMLIGYLSTQLYTLNGRLREQARADRMRNAVDWTKPPERPSRRQKSRISDFLKI
mgnify:CR=1 FL=1